MFMRDYFFWPKMHSLMGDNSSGFATVIAETNRWMAYHFAITKLAFTVARERAELMHRLGDKNTAVLESDLNRSSHQLFNEAQRSLWDLPSKRVELLQKKYGY